MGNFSYFKALMLVFLLLVFPAAGWAQVTLEPSQIQLGSLSFDQLQEAAQAGDPDAQYAIGYMYYYGKGVAANKTIALDWLKRAAVQGQPQAIKAMNMLGTPVHTVPEATPLPSTSSASSTATAVTVTSKTEVTTTTKAAPTGSYMIQLLSTSSKSNADNYIKANHLSGNAKVYTTKKKDKTLYIVGYGNYSSSAEAKAMIKNLPASIRAKKPFVKSTAGLSS